MNDIYAVVGRNDEGDLDVLNIRTDSGMLSLLDMTGTEEAIDALHRYAKAYSKALGQTLTVTKFAAVEVIATYKAVA